MFDTGYYTIFRLRGVAVRVHWSAPLGAIVFTGFSFSPLLWAGFLVLIVLHELGHAFLVRRLGYQVVAVQVHAFGGSCEWAGDPTRIENAVVAWGGVLAQGIVWLLATVILAIVGQPTSKLLQALAETFTSTNAHMILLNLMPIPPLDGHWAWPLIPMLLEARAEQRDYRRARAARRQQKDQAVKEANAHDATKEEVAAMEDAEREEPKDEAPPLPPELKEVLDRILGNKGERRGDGEKGSGSGSS